MEEEEVASTSATADETLIRERNYCSIAQSFSQEPFKLNEDACRSKMLMNNTEISKIIQIVERDSIAIAESFVSLFSSLHLTLSQVTDASVEHMRCFSDTAGLLQESALDAVTKGNRYINSCLRLNEEMKGIESLAMQLKVLRRTVDVLDSAVNKLIPFQ